MLDIITCSRTILGSIITYYLSSTWSQWDAIWALFCNDFWRLYTDRDVEIQIERSLRFYNIYLQQSN